FDCMLIVCELMSLDVLFEDLLELLLYGVVDCVFGTVVSSIGVPFDVGSGSAGGLAAKAPAAISANASPPASNVGERVCNVFMVSAPALVENQGASALAFGKGRSIA